MSNTVSTNISLFAQGALESYREVLAPITAFSTSFSPAEGQVGQAVQVPLYNGSGPAKNFVAGNEYTVDDSTISAVTVNLNNRFYKAVHATDQEVANQGVDLMKLGKMAGRSVAFSVTTGAMALLTTGTYGLPVQTLAGATNFAASGILAGRTKAVAWPEKNAIIDSTYYTSLLGNLPNSDMLQTEGAVNGSIGKLYGFNLFEQNVSPLAGNSQTKAVFASPDAIAIASRTLAPDGAAGVEFEVATDPMTKISIAAKSWYEPAKSRRVYLAEALVGYSVANTGAAAFVFGG